jgi:hypothetical protein
VFYKKESSRIVKRYVHRLICDLLPSSLQNLTLVRQFGKGTASRTEQLPNHRPNISRQIPETTFKMGNGGEYIDDSLITFS